MSYQFYCPAGHLLEAEPDYAGQHCQCPTCGADMLIPPPPSGHAAGHQQPAYEQPVDETTPEEEGFPGLRFGPGPRRGEVEEAPRIGDSAKDDPERILHIPCPNGHELETPMSMVGTNAMCPHCEATFRLKFENSVEGKEERKKQQELKEERWGRSALRWSIILASLAILGLIGLIIAMSLG